VRLPLKPVMSLRARIIACVCSTGGGSRYNATFVARDRRASAFWRGGTETEFTESLGNRGNVLLAGARADVGIISMDVTTMMSQSGGRRDRRCSTIYGRAEGNTAGQSRWRAVGT